MKLIVPQLHKKLSSCHIPEWERVHNAYAKMAAKKIVIRDGISLTE